MSTTLLPINICTSLGAKFMKFWQGENERGNSLMLKCWDSICSPKSCGGLGFIRMKAFDFALFSKLAWQIASNKDTLWVQILHAKYLRGKSFLNDDITHFNSSWIWADVMKCKNLIHKGAIFSINNISDILIWKDP